MTVLHIRRGWRLEDPAILEAVDDILAGFNRYEENQIVLSVFVEADAAEEVAGKLRELELSVHVAP